MHGVVMTKHAKDTHDAAGHPEDIPTRHGQPWTEEDFAGVMRSLRAGRSHDEIARDIGRSPQGLRGQLRRMLPADERHLSPDMVLLRLKQLDKDGDYDWLAAMAEKPTSAAGGRHLESMPPADAQGLATLSDGQVLSIAMTALFSTVPLRDDLRDLVVQQVWDRFLDVRLQQLAGRISGESVAALLNHGPFVRYADHGEMSLAYGDADPWGNAHGDTARNVHPIR